MPERSEPSLCQHGCGFLRPYRHTSITGKCRLHDHLNTPSDGQTSLLDVAIADVKRAISVLFPVSIFLEYL